MKIDKYFWDLNEQALRETDKALKDPNHPQFLPRMITLLSRLDRPKDLFAILPKKVFVEAWPRIRSYWIKRERHSEQRAWWETLQEQFLEESSGKASVEENSAAIFKRFGNLVKEKRLEMGLSQGQLAQRTGLQQPVISQIEVGRKNVTFFTLARLCKVLRIENLKIS